MQWHYDLVTGGEPIIRDESVIGTSDILLGAVVGREGAISTEENRWGLQNVGAADLLGVVGVSNELYTYATHISNTGSNAVSETTVGVTNYIKVIINPLAVWLAEYSQEAADDSANTSADTSGKIITDTVITDLEGDWIYITDVGSTTGGAGNLFQIGTSTSTTDVRAATGYDDSLKGNTASDTYIHLVAPWNASDTAGEVIDLSAASAVAGTQIFSKIDTLPTGTAVIMMNYIRDKHTPMEPLKIERNSGINYDAGSAHLYADLFFTEHILLGSNSGALPTIT